eukprot:TRINITY_DN93619_c0_g1_i1.p1 TRINITY_DN93619_c0_g1~~TRINITY_DN93619_c0_g1_i1.p1  ORF type:complete len:206 (+),score=48.22 TRINITY_DN93619_c0_g1_i1:33-620(+)
MSISALRLVGQARRRMARRPAMSPSTSFVMSTVALIALSTLGSTEQSWNFTCGRLKSAPPSLCRAAGASPDDTMGELFTKYYRLQEVNRQLESDTKAAIVSEMLEILDDLERAQSQTDAGAEVLRVLSDKFQAKLSALGFERVAALGEAFDPNCHEAADRRPAEGFSEGTVCQELRSGWRLGEKVIRPAIVAVAE